jgi:hypothetical protein
MGLTAGGFSVLAVVMGLESGELNFSYALLSGNKSSELLLLGLELEVNLLVLVLVFGFGERLMGDPSGLKRLMLMRGGTRLVVVVVVVVVLSLSGDVSEGVVMCVCC